MATKKIVKKDINKQINYFGFFAILLTGFFVTINFPDLDLHFKSLLGHRSIITHSILLPYLMYYFLIKKKDHTSRYIVIFIIGAFLGIGLHLSADNNIFFIYYWIKLYSGNWSMPGEIKLPGNHDIGIVLSFIWVTLNAITALYFSGLLLNKIKGTKKYWIIYLIMCVILGLVYCIYDYQSTFFEIYLLNVLQKFLTFIFYLFATFYYFYYLKRKEKKK